MSVSDGIMVSPFAYLIFLHATDFPVSLIPDVKYQSSKQGSCLLN